MTYLSAYTPSTPATGYVGYINISKCDNSVVITVRPESADGSGTVALTIPAEEARKLFREAFVGLEPTDG